ncbi:hypothetical protein SAMN05444161_3553 [Rhizobiales bacterium GAS191]|nr:hypothetical protein SAMN05444161_3553 [Rhizobiales bacterium GAS191]
MTKRILDTYLPNTNIEKSLRDMTRPELRAGIQQQPKGIVVDVLKRFIKVLPDNETRLGNILCDHMALDILIAVGEKVPDPNLERELDRRRYYAFDFKALKYSAQDAAALAQVNYGSQLDISDMQAHLSALRGIVSNPQDIVVEHTRTGAEVSIPSSASLEETGTITFAGTPEGLEKFVKAVTDGMRPKGDHGGCFGLRPLNIAARQWCSAQEAKDKDMPEEAKEGPPDLRHV